MNKRIIMQIPLRHVAEDDFQRGLLSDDRTIFIHAASGPDDMLILSLYSAQAIKDGRREPVRCEYITQTDHIARQYDEEKSGYVWRTGRLSSFLHPRDCLSFLDAASAQVVKSFFSTEQNGVTPILQHQDQIVASRLQQRHQRIMDRIDAKMSLIPAVPDDFLTWVNQDVLTERYLYYTYSSHKDSVPAAVEFRRGRNTKNG